MKNVIKAFELKQMENNKLLILIKHEKGCVRHLLIPLIYYLLYWTFAVPFDSKPNKQLPAAASLVPRKQLRVALIIHLVNFQTVPLFSSFSRFARVLLLLPFVMSWDFSFDLIWSLLGLLVSLSTVQAATEILSLKMLIVTRSASDSRFRLAASW